jgi:hypothetical protein
MKSLFRVSFMFGLLCGLYIAPSAQAQMVNAPISTERMPDVQVVAFPLPTREWAITTVYPKVVRRSLAEGRVKTLLNRAGWKATGMEFKDKALERVADNAPKTEVMSSLTFRTAGRVVDLADGTMPLESFARAFRDLERVHITYIVPGPHFAFRGIRQFADNNVEISLSQGQGAYTYLLNIKNHNLENLRLPRYETLKTGQETESARAEPAPKAGIPPVLFGTGLAVLLAVGAGAVAYLIFTRLTAR